MVIFKVYILGGLTRPAERDAVIPASPDGPSGRAAVKEVEPVTGDIHIRGFGGHFQRLQNADALSDVFGANPARTPGEVDLIQSFVPEIGDHDFQCKPNSLHSASVNLVAWRRRRRGRFDSLRSAWTTRPRWVVRPHRLGTQPFRLSPFPSFLWGRSGACRR